jgi:hypothetical protein
MGGGIFSQGSVLIYVRPFPKTFRDEILIQTVIALVEYLTSDEAGQALGNRFAWPVGMIVEANVEEKTKNMNGNSNGHANGSAKMNGNGNVKMNGNGNANGKIL